MVSTEPFNSSPFQSSHYFEHNPFWTRKLNLLDLLNLENLASKSGRFGLRFVKVKHSPNKPLGILKINVPKAGPKNALFGVRADKISQSGTIFALPIDQMQNLPSILPIPSSIEARVAAD
jgi:hypothetical protein